MLETLKSQKFMISYYFLPLNPVKNILHEVDVRFQAVRFIQPLVLGSII